MPVYCCSSLTEPFKRLGIPYIFYDVRQDDLNGDIDSIIEQIHKYKPDSLLAVSMYGNPCELDKLEDLCKNHKIKLIDDAAQSFGAEVNGKKVGYFGDAGFISFSPGKPLAAHMGGLFRVDIDYKIDRTNHPVLHKLLYSEFLKNRCEGFGKKSGKLRKKTVHYMQTHINIANDGIEEFEEGVLMGVFRNSDLLWTPFRTELAHMMVKEVSNNNAFSFIEPYSDNYRKGIAHKYVIKVRDKGEAIRLNHYLHDNQISSQFGYSLLTKDLQDFPNAKRIDGCIIEIPLDPDMDSYKYIKYMLNNYYSE